MKKKVKAFCCNRYTKIGFSVIAIITVLGWAWCVSRPDVGVIDFNVVQAKAKVYQSVLAEQKKYEDQVRILVIADSGDLEKEGQNLEKQRATLKSEEYQKKAAALQRKIMAVQEKYRPAVERIVAASQLALREGAAKYVDEAMEKTANQKGIKVLLPKTATLYTKDSADVTDAFVKNLDKLIQSVPYPDPNKLGG